MKTVAVLTFPMKSKGGKTYTCNMVDGTLSLYFVLEEMCVYDDDYE